MIQYMPIAKSLEETSGSHFRPENLNHVRGRFNLCPECGYRRESDSTEAGPHAASCTTRSLDSALEHHDGGNAEGKIQPLNFDPLELVFKSPVLSVREILESIPGGSWK